MSARIALVSVAIFALGLVLSTSAFEFKDCSNNASKVNSVRVSACPDAKGPYCLIKLLEPATYSANFTTGVAFDEAFIELYYDKYNSWNNGCEKGLKCPAAAGSVQSFEDQLDMIFVRGEYKLQLRVMRDTSFEDNDPILCVEFPVKVVS